MSSESTRTYHPFPTATPTNPPTGAASTPTNHPSNPGVPNIPQTATRGYAHHNPLAQYHGVTNTEPVNANPQRTIDPDLLQRYQQATGTKIDLNAQNRAQPIQQPQQSQSQPQRPEVFPANNHQHINPNVGHAAQPEWLNSVVTPQSFNTGMSNANGNSTVAYHDRPEPVNVNVLSTVQVSAPGAPAPVAEAVGVPVALPSRFVFYEFKDLYIHPLRAYHLAKLSRAHSQHSLLILTEVISSILQTSDPRFNGMPLGFYLTLPDFYWILYYIRLNDFTKATYRHVTSCRNPEHLEKVQKGVLPPESLRIEKLITNSVLENKELQEAPVPDPCLAEAGIRVRPCLMKDTIDLTEHPDFDNEEFQYLAQLAVYIDGGTLDERIKVAETLSPYQVEAIKSYEAAISEYGIQEQTVVTCKECGASRKTKVSIDASAFLPS